jgi:hypothetical protein
VDEHPWAHWERPINSVAAVAPVTECSSPVRVRIHWHQSGWLTSPATATGWAGTAVRVQLADPVLVVWLDAADVYRTERQDDVSPGHPSAEWSGR